MNGNVKIPDNVLYILNKLSESGFTAYLVGGCVRDFVLNREPNDWDIATDAKPEKVKQIFDKTIDTGIKHGTVTVILNGCSYEITTFRIDGEYEDNRRPSSVSYTSSIEEDLGRRDFTINSIAYNPEIGFIDPFNGLEDIKNGLIRCVGDADKRFSEDALRLLRAVRFSAQLDFSIESKTYDSICKNSFLINNISSERISDELNKILLSDNPGRFFILRDTKLLHHILPEFDICFGIKPNDPHHIHDVGTHSIMAAECIDKDKILRWTMLLHDTGKALINNQGENNTGYFNDHPEHSTRIAENILRRLRFDTVTINTVCRLIQYHERNIIASPKAVRKALRVVGDDIFESLLKVKEANARANNPEYLCSTLNLLKEIKQIYAEIKDKRQCTKIKDLAINGHDLLRLGFKPGKEIGQILDKLLDLVIDYPHMNNKEQLIKAALQIRTPPSDTNNT